MINRLKHTLPPRVYLHYITQNIETSVFLSCKKEPFVQFLILNILNTQNRFLNYFAYLICQSCITFSSMRYITKSKRGCLTSVTIVIPTLTHSYFTRHTADQQNRTYYVFADHTCLHSMIDLLNKSHLIKGQVTTSVNLNILFHS